MSILLMARMLLSGVRRSCDRELVNILENLFFSEVCTRRIKALMSFISIRTSVEFKMTPNTSTVKLLLLGI